MVTEKKQPRICILSDQLATGGAERCSGLLSVFFEKNNCKVHHIIVVDKIEYEYAGEILNLGKLKNNTNDFSNRLKRFWVLRNFFKNNSFDYIIDTRVKRFQFQEFFIAKFIFNAPLIISVHSFMTELYFPKNNYLANTIYNNTYKIIAVSNKIEAKVVSNFKYDNCETIYNSIDFEFIESKAKEKFDSTDNFILAIGRMEDNVKQFDILINCYANSILPEKNIRLYILGDGSYRKILEILVQQLNLTDKVFFKGKIENPFSYYSNAMFTVLTSKNEGFPTVLLESLACNTPVVAFNCDSGPSEIIINYENGILVENQNQDKLRMAMNKMVYNEILYYHCKANAKLSVQSFSMDTIGNQWLKMMKIK